MKINAAQVGIDYSITGPAMCVHLGEEWSIDNCSFFFLAGRKKIIKDWTLKENVIAHGMEVCKDYKMDVERFMDHAEKFLDFIEDIAYIEDNFIYNICDVALEGYAYGARGKVFNIGENTGILKYRLINGGYDLAILQPSEVKKFATGRGNANKFDMYEAWEEETEINLERLMGINCDKGPINDIVDSYYICKLAWNNRQKVQDNE